MEGDFLKLVMLESINDGGYWEWQHVLKDTTPKKAIKEFLKDCGDDFKGFQEEGSEVYANGYDLRAYYIYI